MSASTGTRSVLARVGGLDPARLLALAAVGGLVVSFVTVFRRITNVAGDPQALVAVAALSVAAGAVAAPVLSGRLAAVLSALALAAGGAVYLFTLDAGTITAEVLAKLLDDSLQLLTGASLLGVINADVWAMAGVPAPAFLTTYLALRRHYVGAVGVGGATLSVFVLTGDATSVGTLFGVLAATAAVGFGELDGRAGSEGVDAVVATLAAMVLVTLSVTVVPAGGALGAPSVGVLGGGGGPSTVESNLVTADGDLRIQGSVRLSPKVRFSVETDEPRYWRVGSYDRYTSGGWVRTGSTSAFEGGPEPPGPSRRLVQEVEAETALRVLPAAWRPVDVDGVEAGVRRTMEGGLVPGGTVDAGSAYTVVSSVPAAEPRLLQATGDSYPAAIERRYTQLPSSTPDRVRERTADITSTADTPYERALLVERWLENNREYSLDVSRPRGDVADAFLFERTRGYCTYFATTMTVMLRSQGIPARFVVGYTPGERVGPDRWVARGLDAHAWVEVYFPDVGWIRFDPTPGGPRVAAEQERLTVARERNVSGVDTDETGQEEWTPTPDPDPDTSAPNGTPDLGSGFDQANIPGLDTPGGVDSTPVGAGATGGGLPLPEVPLPTRQQAVLGGVVLAGAVAGVRRLGVAERAYRAVWLRYQPRGDPAADVDRAYRRATWALERRWRPRRPGETPRQYLGATDDDRAARLAALYERARYADRVDRTAADEAVSLADAIVGERIGPGSR